MSTLQKLEKMFTHGKISRREFITRVSALGLAAAISPAFLTTPVHAASPKKGGRLRIACTGGSTTDSLDPGKLTSQYNQVLNFQLRNCLVEIDQNSNAIPELAESWEPSPDAVKWVFNIRQGVEFHNGKTLDADDVVYTMNYHRAENSKSGAKGLLDPVEDIRADGKHAVVFTLKSGNADFPAILADYHLTIFADGTKGLEFEKGIGTGGYILKSWEPGVNSLTIRNPNYWKTGRAHFDEVEMLSIVDTNARTNALRSGQIDVMDRPDLKTIHLFKKLKSIQVINKTSGSHSTIPMLFNKPPYHINDVRLGLKYALDREEQVKKVLMGYGSVGNDHPIGSSVKYHAAKLPQRAYDPDKAKFHMKKAGMLDHTFKLHTADSAFGGAVDSALLYQQSAAKAGIKIQVVKEPSDGYWSNVWMKKPWCMSYWSARPTADLMFTTCYAADANWNETFWKNERFNKLLVEARAELDEKKRAEMYYETQKIVKDQGATVVPMFSDIVVVASTKIAYDNFGAGLDLDDARGPERWWFKS
ncbi:MAG: peptide ABC transporter substrate-binding protein [Desulfobacteraceae bacterium 4572_123]|nr:MAG: peptide ABC transporter substrate-binding protein [Desulfobacteraceae bacterium 4572_123]